MERMQTAEQETTVNTRVDLPRVHMAGSNAHHTAHLEVGQHGIALFLAPDAEYPVLDVDGTSEQLEEVVRELQAALAVRRGSGTNPTDAAQMSLLSPAPEAERQPSDNASHSTCG
jgi:hypothetical protein